MVTLFGAISFIFTRNPVAKFVASSVLLCAGTSIMNVNEPNLGKALRFALAVTAMTGGLFWAKSFEDPDANSIGWYESVLYVGSVTAGPLITCSKTLVHILRTKEIPCFE